MSRVLKSGSEGAGRRCRLRWWSWMSGFFVPPRRSLAGSRWRPRRGGHQVVAVSSVECSEADRVVDGGGHLERGTVAILADAAQRASFSDGLDPAKRFFDPCADPLRDVLTAGPHHRGRVQRSAGGPVAGPQCRSWPVRPDLVQPIATRIAAVSSGGESSCRKCPPVTVMCG